MNIENLRQRFYFNRFYSFKFDENRLKNILCDVRVLFMIYADIICLIETIKLNNSKRILVICSYKLIYNNFQLNVSKDVLVEL